MGWSFGSLDTQLMCTGTLPLAGKTFIINSRYWESWKVAKKDNNDNQESVGWLQGQPSIFGRFAAEWFPVMVDALIGDVEKPEEVGIHYFLLDACVTFLGWPALFPVPPRGGAAPTLMNYLVRIQIHANSFHSP